LEFHLSGFANLRKKSKNIYFLDGYFIQNYAEKKELLYFYYHDIRYRISFSEFNPKDYSDFFVNEHFLFKNEICSFIDFDNIGNFNDAEEISTYNPLTCCYGHLIDTFLFMFFIEDVILTHISTFNIDRYIFIPYSNELDNFYKLLLRKYMCDSDRKVNVYYRVIQQDDGEVAYYEICK